MLFEIVVFEQRYNNMDAGQNFRSKNSFQSISNIHKYQFSHPKTFYTLSTKMHLIKPIILSLLSTTALALPATNQSHAGTALDKRAKEGWLGSFVSNDCSGPVSTNSISDLKEDQVSVCIAQTLPSSKHLVAPSSWTVHPSDLSQAPVSTLDREKLT